MSARYLCREARRVAAVRDTFDNPQPDPINGFDYLEVVSSDQTVLDVFFVHPLPGEAGGIPAAPALTAANFVITGGDRITGISIEEVVETDGNRIRLRVDAAGDFSTYVLHLIRASGESEPPQFFDPRLAGIEFLFKAGCPSDFDCAPVHRCPPAAPEEPRIDYLAKDYESFRRVMLDRLAVLMPGWQDRSAADPYLAMVETLAYHADRLSYAQDAAGTEAYLGTARSRISLRRHARLVDYAIDEGANARTLVHFTVAPASAADGTVLPAGQLVAGLQPGAGAVLDAAARDAALRSEAAKFETMADVSLSSAHNEIALHTWSDTACCLPPGALGVTLKDNPKLSLAPGDLLLLAQSTDPETGARADADPRLRHAVRLTAVRYGTDPVDATPVCEVAWAEADALPFALPVDSMSVDGEVLRCAVAMANLAPADAGYWAPDAALLPDTVLEDDRPYRPLLGHRGVVFAAGFDPEGPVAELLAPPAGAPTQAAIRVASQGDDWDALPDLFAADRFARAFVPEVEHDGTVVLRFGDDTLGARPAPGTSFTAAYRVGGGAAGNVGLDVLRHVATPPRPGIVAVTNPLPARGGRDGESATHIRRFAPARVAQQDRAVTEADYAAAVEELPGVQRAQARIRWTGSWYTVFLIVDRIGGQSATGDPAFAATLLEHLERKRMAGFDLDIADPVHVALDLELHVCVQLDAIRANVRQRLEELFSARTGSDGTLGFFHPDRRSFGDPVYASAILAAAVGVEGVRSAALTRFGRAGAPPVDPVLDGVITPSNTELLRLDNDPDHPDMGRIRFDLEGGR
ncbi:putative baseplate assembly protein [Novosphingobium sp. CF614]|uniref:putative baseplate assembly protein n=1 Tax=Novosphingobium sp. CF614 TaxID=1884364 RepID=UPI0008EA551E|nr:putative baseplate assembly protein [Novosphingobium sp. CF614]SFF76485.1 putative baseplate assembly protein [Novosphingobium sp. CF614]